MSPRWIGIAALGVASSSCGFDSAGPGGAGADAMETASSLPTGQDDVTASSLPTGADGESSEAGSGSSTGDVDPTCPPANIGCACADGACFDGLSCQDGVCVAWSCGDGVVSPGEECEPDPNDALGDGCEVDCTFSTGARNIALGHEHTCAITYAGAVRCWGSGERGKTGLGTDADIGRSPGSVAVAPDVTLGALARSVALGTGFSCALREPGDVVCWGYRANGRLGDGLDDSAQDIGDAPGETADSLGPLAIPGVVVDIAVGGSHACALSDGGQIFCWGMGGSGRLGYGNTADVGVTNTPAMADAVPLPLEFEPVQIAAGAGHTCALGSSGDVRCWGDGAHGMLGTVSTITIGDDEPASAGGVAELGGPAVAISAGAQHTCALMEGGDVRCWGLGAVGRLGYGNNDSVGDDESPAGFTVPLASSALQVSAGRAHTCALLQDRSVLCWGEGGRGQLGRGENGNIGDNEVLDGLAPIEIEIESRGAVGVREVQAGGDHTCAVLVDGRVRCWGEAESGQLGYGNTEDIGNNELPAVAGDVDFGG